MLFVPLTGGQSHPKTGDWLLEVRIVSDSGWEMPDNRIEPDASNFVDVEKAASTLSLMVFKCVEDVPPGHNWFHNVWRNAHWPEDSVEPDENGLMYLEDSPLASCQIDIPIEQLPSQAGVREFCERAKQLMGVKLDIAFESVRRT
jgi:hypothetical protein